MILESVPLNDGLWLAGGHAAFRTVDEKTLSTSELARALDAVGLPRDWTERCPDDEKERYASPTILVDGEDVVGGTGGRAPGCRIYRDDRGRRVGGPPIEIVGERLRRARREYRG